jgi:hypothetical protein
MVCWILHRIVGVEMYIHLRSAVHITVSKVAAGSATNIDTNKTNTNT